ncbi:hypothetical protein H9P43_005936 [Blastocladiella emersonii ATCC 22665]|nr:hypothetical protein H9P43_005936 [Blastocladiella emersonii ATCC 22665]
MSANAGFCGLGRSLAIVRDSAELDLDPCFEAGIVFPAFAAVASLVFALRIRSLNAADPLPPAVASLKRGLLFAKLPLGLSSLVLALLQVVRTAAAADTAGFAPVVGYAALAVPLVLAFVLHIVEQSHARRASSFLCSFYLALILVLVVRLRSTWLESAARPADDAALLVAQIAVSALLFLLENASTKIDPTPPAKPDDGRVKSAGASPESQSSFLGAVLLVWYWDLLLGRKRKGAALALADLWDLPAYFDVRASCDELEAAVRRHAGNLRAAIFATYGLEFAFILGIKFLSVAVTLSSPLFVGYFVSFVQNRDTPQGRPVSEGVAVAALFTAIKVMGTVVEGTVLRKLLSMQNRARYGIQTLVYRKAIRLNLADAGELKGKVITHAQSDAMTIAITCQMAIEIFIAPFYFFVGGAMLVAQVGWVALVAPAIMAATAPVISRIGDFLGKFQEDSLVQTDGRTKAITEALAGIKLLKLSGWTAAIHARIMAFRDRELAAMRRLYGALALQGSFVVLLNSVSAFAVFGLYALTAGPGSLSMAKIFIVLSVLALLAQPLATFAYGMSYFVGFNTATKCVAEFLSRDEVVPYVHAQRDVNVTTDMAPAVAFEGRSTFAFDAAATAPVLTVEDLEINHGSVTAVVGPVGAGKSALLLALLGEMHKMEEDPASGSGTGTVRVRGSAVYMAQAPFITNASIAENVLFGLQFKREAYLRTLDACALGPDLATLEAGDRTVIGARGINLSGGQNSRLALARIVYSVLVGSTSLVLLDDPLGNLDNHVARHVFHALFDPAAGILRAPGVTTVLVTHGLHYLPAVDDVLVLDAGRVKARGTYADLVKAGDEEVLAIITSAAQAGDEVDDGKSETTLAPSAGETSSASGKAHTALAQVDLAASAQWNPAVDGPLAATAGIEVATAVGFVHWRTHITYARHCGVAAVALVLALKVGEELLKFTTEYWLGLWGAASSAGTARDGYYLAVYAGITLGISLVGAGATFYWRGIVSLAASRKTMDDAVRNVLRLPLAFFDATPAGQVTSRLTADQKAVDAEIPEHINGLMYLLVAGVLTLLAMTAAAPWFAVLIVPIVLAFAGIQSVFLAPSLDLQRITQALNSPVVRHFTETLDGIATVRGGGPVQVARFTRRAETAINLAAAGMYENFHGNAWLLFYVQLLGAVLISVLMFLVVTTPASRSPILGVALSNAFVAVDNLCHLIRIYSRLAAAMVSLERIREYSALPTEAAAETTAFPLDPVWPARGEVRIRGLSVRYADDKPMVLKGINLTFEAGKKIGIVGRTGAGKSSMALALFRGIEPTSGSIHVDGLDIATLGLDDLRSRLTLLPQEAVVLSATVRENLAMTRAPHDDATLWAALRAAQLDELVRGLDGGLDAVLSPASLSAGEAQLLCLARAILRKSRVLVLDEASRSMDHASDAVVQATLRTEFVGCTIITIAHRINTIVDYDKVLVLGYGEVIEFDSPQALLARPDSVFYSLAKECKLV